MIKYNEKEEKTRENDLKIENVKQLYCCYSVTRRSEYAIRLHRRSRHRISIRSRQMIIYYI